MPAPFTSKQAGAFLRSVTPAEPAQWLLLVGSTLLLISHKLPWQPSLNFSSHVFREPARWATYAYLLSWPLLFAGIAGYYLALISTTHAARKLFYWVLLPGITNILVIIVAAFLRLPVPRQLTASVLDQTNQQRLTELAHIIMNLGPGIVFASAGVLLVAAFLCLMQRGRARVPMLLPAANGGPSETNEPALQRNPQKTMIFVWAMICFVPLACSVEGLLLGTLWGLSPFARADAQIGSLVFTVAGVFFMLALILLATGKNDGIMAIRTLRLSPIKYVLLAFFFPLAVASVWPLLNYAHDRILWASYQWGQLAPPTLGSYFGTWQSVLLIYFLLAIPEEVAWRGYLQPRFIGRYGVMRGIFLVGVVWGAFHFISDSWAYPVSTQAALHLVNRVIGTVTLSYPLGWLTMKSRSVVPSMIGHAMYNISVVGSVISETPWWIATLLLGLVGYLMFRFDPPEAATTVTAATGAEVAPEQNGGTKSRSAETA